MRFIIDFRDALRSLRATPVITAVAVLSLALGIGANTALFSILNGLILKPLPVKDPQHLALIDDGSWTFPIWEQIQPHGRELFDGAFAWAGTTFDLSEHGTRDQVNAAYASGDIFTVLGVSTQIGRTFTPADDARGGGPDGTVAVISDGFWKKRFGGSASVIGQRLLLDRHPFTIVGVLPAGFFGMDVGRVADVIVPMSDQAVIQGPDAMLDNRSAWWLDVYLRTKTGQSTEQASVALNSIRAEVREGAIPQNWTGENRASFLRDPFTVVDASTGASTLRSRYSRPLTIVLVVVGVVLLIACANIANLLLARATARRPELSLRLALGASRGRIARQLLSESLLLGAVGAILGLFVARWASALLVNQLATSVNRVVIDLGIDWRVLGFTAGISLATTLLFGLAPVFGLARLTPNDVLKESSRSVSGDRRFGLRNALVVTQVALSLALVVGAGLFVRTFSTLNTTPLGFEPSQLTVVNVTMGQGVVGDQMRYAEALQFADAAAAVPGVERASAALFPPMSGVSWNDRVRVRDGIAVTGRQSETFVNGAGPGFFETMAMPLLAGEAFTTRDTIASPKTAVVNQAFVKRFIGDVPAASVLGRVVLMEPEPGKTVGDELRIVGVVTDSIYRTIRQGVVPVMFVPLAQTGKFAARVPIIVRIAAKGSADTERALAAALSRVDGQASFSFRAYNDMLRGTLAPERVTAILSGFFGALALLLAALGLYGVTAHSVNRRRSEIAIRMALGATAGVVVRDVLRRVGTMVAVGVVVGIALSWWASTYVQTLLFGLPARDVVTMAVAAGVLAATGILAGWLPARRASKLDPAAVLRD